jgi:hypothetical protein
MLERDVCDTEPGDTEHGYDFRMYATGCPTRYRTRYFFNNSNTNEDNAIEFEREYIR